MYWEREVETQPRDELVRQQVSMLNRTLAHTQNASFYREVLNERAGRSSPPRVASLDDVAGLPFTTKEDLRNAFPYGFLSVPKADVVRLHSSSGTTGNPTVVYHTASDLEEWRNLIARCMYMTGVRKDDVFQNMMGYGLFTGGLGFHYGAEKLGALTIPIGPGNSKRQIWFMKEFQTSVIHVLPSYALRLSTLFEEMGVDTERDLSLRIAFVGAEPHSDGVRKKIESLLNVRAFNSYGLSEMCGPGVAFECENQNGMHLWEDHFVAEIIDPVTGKALSDGKEGELVLTTLRRHAMPLIRYRTRDLTRIIPGECSCGRTHRRIDRIKGRTDDMLIINGVNVFPMQIEKTIMRIPEIGNNYMIELRKENYMDKTYVMVEVSDQVFRGTISELENVQRRLTEEIKSEIGITPRVKLVEASSLPVSEGKACRVNDLRNEP